MRPPLRAILLLLAGALAAAGCKAKAGDKCQAGQDTCEDSATALACVASVLVEARCGGPAGCAKKGQKIDCDDSLSVEGEPCLTGEHENHACSADKTESLFCVAGKWKAVQRCTGAKGCTINGDAVTCDVRGEAAGDPCPRPGTFACAADAKSRVACKDGKFTFDRFCKGQGGCRDHDVACDQSIADVGDTCGLPGALACGSDGKSELLCQGGQFAVKQSCGGQGCQVAANRRIECALQ
jgi:hypothetical protein